jgi:hypothetical protein
MTVNELIAELKKHPPETRVIVTSYEDGFDDISCLSPIYIAPIPKAKPYEGRWQQENSGEAALFLFGRGRDEKV